MSGKFPNHKYTVNFERSGDDGLLFMYRLGYSRGITFVTSEFSVVSFLCDLDAVSKKYFLV